jgi:hypothetical protein
MQWSKEQSNQREQRGWLAGRKRRMTALEHASQQARVELKQPQSQELELELELDDTLLA